jgi:hypothetical protein
MKYVYIIFRVWNDLGNVGENEDDNWEMVEVWGDRKKCEKRRKELNVDESDKLYYDMVMKEVL